VKKNVYNWRFCGYRDFKMVIVFNKFPITPINEAIDELVGVVIFFQAIITIWLSPKSYEQGGYS
jgi:hypothetical protein